MIKKIIHQIRSIKIKKRTLSEAADKKNRVILERKVLRGTDKAIREYGDVFKKLAEYDRS